MEGASSAKPPPWSGRVMSTRLMRKLTSPTCTVSPTLPPSVERSLESGQASPRGGPEDMAVGVPKATSETPTVPRSG